MKHAYGWKMEIPLFQDLQARAKKRRTTIANLVRRFILLGMAVDDNPGQFFVMRNGQPQEVFLLEADEHGSS
jgi:hypothetical protein